MPEPSLERILCAVDLSEPSRRACDYALALGRRFEAEVRVVHVVDVQGWGGADVIPAEARPADLRTSLEEDLAWWVARGLVGDSGVATDVLDGPVPAGILAAAAQWRIDLIVIGRHGAGAGDRSEAGSVAGRVLDGAHCPVLVVPSSDGAVARVGPAGRIVCATDLSAASDRAMAYVRLLAGEPPGPLSLLTVVEGLPDDTAGAANLAALRPRLDEALTARLEAAAAAAGLARSARIEVRYGCAGLEVLRHAREVRAELIVLGASERGAAGGLPPATTANRVIGGASCPVLVVTGSGARHVE